MLIKGKESWIAFLAYEASDLANLTKLHSIGI